MRMTRAEAIEYLIDEHKQRCDGYTSYLSHYGHQDICEEQFLDALEMAITALQENEELRNSYDQLQAICDTMYASNNAMGAALREQEQREHGCEYCEGVRFVASPSPTIKPYVYCPMCGRRLED